MLLSLKERQQIPHAAAPAKSKLPDPILALLAEADIEKGAKISKACAACHSFEKGGPLKQGPNLWNIVNAPKCAVDAFSYSDGLKGNRWHMGLRFAQQIPVQTQEFCERYKNEFCRLEKGKRQG